MDIFMAEVVMCSLPIASAIASTRLEKPPLEEKTLRLTRFCCSVLGILALAILPRMKEPYCCSKA